MTPQNKSAPAGTVGAYQSKRHDFNGYDAARAALQSIPSDLPRDEWVKAGMAAQAAGLEFEDFNDWSATADNYDARAARDTWKSFHDGKGIGAGTLFRLAREHGWKADGTVQRLARAPAPKTRPGMAPAEVWARCIPATNAHPYIEKKRAAGAPLEGLRVVPEGDALTIGGASMAGALAVPAYGPAGALQSLQLIPPQGQKMNLPGCPMSGASFTVGTPDAALYLVEGLGTAWAIWQATGCAAVVCFGWGNVAAIARQLHQKDEAARLVLVPDAGKEEQAEALARELGISAAFMPEASPSNFDAWDLKERDGGDALAALLESAREFEQETGWPEPEPLPDALPAVAPFEAELLPEAFRGWAMDIAERMQCPADFPAVGALVALSAVIGARAAIAPKERDDWRVVPNLWGVVVGRPGVMKSPALSEALKPLHRLELAERERWEKAHAEWETECRLAELQAKQNEKAAAAALKTDKGKARELLQPAELPEEPTMRRLVVNDSTQEKLADLLTVNPWGLLVYRDELHGLLCSMDREGQEGARGFYLTGYDGNQGYAVDRIGRGESYVPRVCLAMLGGIQPGKVQSYVRDAVRGGKGDDGLLQRFGLAVWPDITGDFRKVDRWPDTEAKQRAWAVFERLAALQPVNDAEPVVLHFTPEAQALYWEWAEPFERELRGADLHPALVSHMAKYRKLIPALALIFALVDTPDAGAVGARELARALDWGEYLRTHAERLYAAAVVPETAGAEALLAKILAGKLCDADGVLHESFTPRQVAMKHWAGLATPDEARKAAELLAEYGWLRADTIQSGDALGRGRPSERYTLHPELLKGGAA